jgi:hypothetical protein
MTNDEIRALIEKADESLIGSEIRKLGHEALRLREENMKALAFFRTKRKPPNGSEELAQ